MRQLRSVFVILLAVLIVFGGSAAAARGGYRSSAETPSPATAISSDATPVPAGATAVPLAASSNVLLTLSLEQPGAAALARLLSAVENPASPDYRHFLTYSQYVQEFAPPASEAASVVAFLTAAGARSVTVFPDRSSVMASFTPSEIRSLFGVELVRYGGFGSLPLYTATGTLALPAALRGLVSGVNGLSDEADAGLTWNLVAAPAAPLTGARGPSDFVYDNGTHSQWFVGSDYTQLFGATRLFPGPGSVPNATFPTKVAIATLLASAYNETYTVNLPPWDPAVVSTYFNVTFPSTWPKPSLSGAPVTIGGVTPPMPGSFGGLNDSTADEFENSLDLEMAGSVAPGASVVNFYFAGSLLAGSTSYSAAADDFAESLSDALAYNYGTARLAVVSSSFGLPDRNDSSWNLETQAAALMGVTLVTASGDQGNAPDSLTGRGTGPWPTWPATADSNVSGSVAVGGVSLTVGGQPTVAYNDSGALNLAFDSNMTGITSVLAWYDAYPGEQVAGTEGGVSTVFREPGWQFDSAAQPAIVNATIKQGAGALGRAEPDVAMPANDTIATVWANSTEAIFFTVLEGTSVAAPVLAGLLADVVAVESNSSPAGWHSLGFLAPEIYRVASYFAASPSSADPFTAVTVGRNYEYAAAPGWDPLTGWGLVNAPLLLAADENPAIRNYSYSGPTPGLPPAAPGPTVPWGEIYIIFGVGIALAVALVLVMARPRRSKAPSMIPYGARVGAGAPFGPGVQGGIYPGATYLCPYCGAVRSVEPVRCPQCGAL